MKNRLFLIDAYALIYRSYYAFIRRPMRNSKGENTSAIFGFTKFLFDIIKREKPHYLGVAFDPKGGTFRNELYKEYKANREETPEDIIVAVPYIKRILEAMRIPILEIPGFEADDVIGTLAEKAAVADFDVYMVTPDKDFGQLVDHSIYIYKQRRNGEGIEIVDRKAIKEHYQIADPKLIIDILALWGDASDNIPGVPGIGEKGAIKLVSEFGTVENILANIDKLKGKQSESLSASQEQLKLSKILATIDTNVPIEFVPDELDVEDPDCDALREIFKELDFNMFIREIESGTLNFCSNGVAGSENNRTVGGAVAEATPTDQPPINDQAKFGINANSLTERKRQTLAGQGDLFGGTISSEQGSLFDVSSYQTIETVEHNYHTINSVGELIALVDKLHQEKEFCFDAETTGFDLFNDRIVGLAFCYKEHEAYYVPWDGEKEAEYVAIIKPLFENEKIIKIAQNIKFDMMVLAQLGIEVHGFKADTMILHYLLNPDSRHNMNHLARTLLNYSPIEIEALIGRGSKQLTMDMVHPDQVSKYAAEDADVTYLLYKKLWPMVVEQQVEELYRTIEEPLIEVLASMELTGIRLDKKILWDYSKELSGELATIEKRICELADEPALNVNSPKQLGEVLFEKLKVDNKPKLTKSKQYKTDEETLQGLYDKHEIVPLILEYRGLKKLLSTYIDALPLLVNSKTGRIHTSYNQAVTSTGRLSSTNPNLQNIPIRGERGREIRRAFIASDGDHLLLSVDYSQVELRIMAHLSEDQAMIEAFERGEDIHTATAARIFNVPTSEVTADQRRKAKTANFGIIYGISVFGLAQRLAIPRGEAKEIIDGYFASYDGVRKYMDNIIKQAHVDGYVSTIFGRKRYLPDIHSSNSNVRGLAERNAINAPIQGSAADIIKLAMFTINREFKKREFGSKMLLQVHDELVFDLLKSEQKEVVKVVIEAMENAASLRVKLIADATIGENWMDGKKINV